MRNLIILILFCTGFIVSQTQNNSELPEKLKIKSLLQTFLSDEFTPGREIIIDYVEIPPNTTLGKHWHPGEEFHYYLDGEVEIIIDNEPSITGTPGTVGHVPFKKSHIAKAGNKGAKILVFRVHTKGEPMRYPEEGDNRKE